MGNDGVIVWNTREPLYGKSPEAYEAELKRLLQGRVEAAWFFGSFGTPSFGRDSDVDIILVVDTKKPFLERALDFPELMDLAASTDLLVYTPQEFADLTTDPSPGFWTSVVASLRRLL